MFKSNDHEMSEMWQEQAKQSETEISQQQHKRENERKRKEKKRNRQRKIERERQWHRHATVSNSSSSRREGATMQARGMTEVCIANKEAAQVNLSSVSETSELRGRKREEAKGRESQ